MFSSYSQLRYSFISFIHPSLLSLNICYKTFHIKICLKESIYYLKNIKKSKKIIRLIASTQHRFYLRGIIYKMKNISLVLLLFRKSWTHTINLFRNLVGFVVQLVSQQYLHVKDLLCPGFSLQGYQLELQEEYLRFKHNNKYTLLTHKPDLAPLSSKNIITKILITRLQHSVRIFFLQVLNLFFFFFLIFFARKMFFCLFGFSYSGSILYGSGTGEMLIPLILRWKY